MTQPRVRAIVGPTAAGKSAVALALAESFRAVIISADARQVYRGFDVGTAKPAADERARVPHAGIDVVDPIERYSAAAWAQAADGWLDDATGRGRSAVVVGGTGFYLRALFEPFFDEPPLDPERRRRLEPLLRGMSLPELRRWCAALDPARAALGRTQLLRAVEVALLAGRRISELHDARRTPPRRRARYLLVDPGASLHARIATRTASMLDGGWPEEVARLHAIVPAEAPAWNACGYAVVRSLVEGRLSRDAAQEAIVIETRQYAKRQRTWFRHQLPAADVTRLDPTDPGWEDAAVRWWREDDDT